MFTDAQNRAALGFVQKQASYIEPQVYKTEYPDIQYQNLIPVDTSANPFVKTVTYMSSDMAGRAEWVNGNADDVPMADTSMAQHETQVHTAAIGYGYGFEEVNYAQMLGINLGNDRADAARRAYEEMVDRVALMGDSSKGFVGLFNSPDVPTTPATGVWSAANSDAILDDVNSALMGIYEGTNTASMADTLLLPYQAMRHLNKRLPNGNTSVMDYLTSYNVYTTMTGNPLTIRGIRGLNEAGAGGAGRVIAYRRSPDVLKMFIPMPHRFLPARPAGALRIEVPGVFRIGGLDIRKPKQMVYLDGI
jgi:hypothetical protein